MAEAPLTERLPRDFGKYRLEKRIATGGMAEVFLAHRLDAPLEPLVIKRILPHLIKSGDFVQMFLDEARIAAQLSHPNVVGILDIGQVEGTYYLAMEYVHGEDIRRIYNRAYKLQRSLPLSHSIRVIADAALGLGHAHKLTDLAGQPLGLVHRDVSPQNILVTYDGEAKVVDFGIAKAANKVAETRAGVLKGKYSYMSPEQALGEGIDHRTDIFALGIILYETTTGTRLFKRENELATLQAIIKCEYLPPSQALQNYPPELEQILRRALAKRKEDRYPDGEAFSAALYDFLYDSGLYVERESIAEFMQDLFHDRLQEEEGSGVPAHPPEHEVREEMVGPQTSAERPRRREEPDQEAAPGLHAAFGLGSSVPRFPRAWAPPDAGDMVVAYTASDSDVEDLEAAARAAGFADEVSELDADATRRDHYDEAMEVPTPLPELAVDAQSHVERRKSTYVVRRTVEREAPDTIADPEPAPDQAPTVAVASYRPSSPAPSGRPGLVEVPPERSQHPRGLNESTDRIRARAERGEHLHWVEPTARSRNPSRPRVPLGQPWWSKRVVLVAAAGIVTLVVAVLTGVLLSRWSSRPALPPEREQAVVDAPELVPPPARRGGQAKVTILTEPGAEVYASGEPLGTADADGAAGPFSMPAGEVLIRVSHRGLGFERQRPLNVEAGQNYQVEVQGRHGWLRLAVAPWARVTVDGKEMGLTPLPRLTLLEGVHEVVLVNPDISRRYQGMVRILAGEEAALKVDLQKSGERL